MMRLSNELSLIQSTAQTQKEQILADLAQITPEELSASGLTEIKNNLKILNELIVNLKKNNHNYSSIPMILLSREINY